MDRQIGYPQRVGILTHYGFIFTLSEFFDLLFLQQVTGGKREGVLVTYMIYYALPLPRSVLFWNCALISPSCSMLNLLTYTPSIRSKKIYLHGSLVCLFPFLHNHFLSPEHNLPSSSCYFRCTLLLLFLLFRCPLACFYVTSCEQLSQSSGTYTRVNTKPLR